MGGRSFRQLWEDGRYLDRVADTGPREESTGEWQLHLDGVREEKEGGNEQSWREAIWKEYGHLVGKARGDVARCVYGATRAERYEGAAVGYSMCSVSRAALEGWRGSWWEVEATTVGLTRGCSGKGWGGVRRCGLCLMRPGASRNGQWRWRLWRKR